MDIVNDQYYRKSMISWLGDFVNETKTNVYACALMSNRMHILLKSGLLKAGESGGTIGQRTGRKSCSYHGRNGTAIGRDHFRHFEDI